MKKFIPLALITFLFISTDKTFAQGKEVTLDPLQVVADILPIMIHAELRLAEKQSFTLGGGLALSAYYENVNGQENFEFFTTPFVTASFRNYYNRSRFKKDNLRNNSGNYVGIYSTYQFKTSADDVFGNTLESNLDSYAVGPVWGIQRNYASGIHLDVSIGIGYYGGGSDDLFEVESGVNLLGGFEFGFRFN